VARAVTDDFFRSHPDWVVRYGNRGRQKCTADVCFELEFLAGSIEAGSPEAFGDYSRWTARMLGARGIAAHSLDENLAMLGLHTFDVLLPEEREALRVFLSRGREACLEPEDPPADSAPVDSLSLTRKVFLASILNGQRKTAIQVVEEALRSGASHADIYVRVFTESLLRVGELWELNRISVAQEHMATAITQYAIAVIYPSLVPAAVRRGSMVVTGVAGERHQIGANLVADAMEEKGWNVRFLGTDLPHTSVLAAVEESAADTLCISSTLVASLPSVVELVGTVRSTMGERAPKIVLGGSAYRLATRFAGEIGATGSFTHLQAALAALCA